MERILIRKLRMYGSTRTVLTSYEQTWKNALPFKTNVANFFDYMDKIEQKEHDQKSSKAESKAKKQLLNTMIEAALTVCGAGAAYAGDIKDNRLKEKFSFSKSMLKAGNEKAVYKRCKEIGEEAALIATQLADYNLTAAQLKMLTDAVKNFFKAIDVPRAVRSAAKTSREEMILLFDECDRILEEIIDNLMLTYKASNADFFLEYSNARIIGGWKKKKEEGGDETTKK